MPELPEVETTCRGIEPHITGNDLQSVSVLQPSLRWPVPDSIEKLAGCRVGRVWRRAKYILIDVNRLTSNRSKGAPAGTLIIHLGMSGSLRICSNNTELRKHDHAEFRFHNGVCLRYHDPRRFGCILLSEQDVSEHALLSKLGPEPLSEAFDGKHLHRLSRKRKTPIKNFIMDSHIVVGVGNIYASESLFSAGIRPGRSASRVNAAQCDALAAHIKRILGNAIEMGGTTLRDFVNSEGSPGYFSQQLQVYGRSGEACRECGDGIKNKVIGQRSSFYCPTCQS